ncbi:hypothetical protein [Campylobacter sp. RKI_CA19_01122]|uniref:hypothetical protein n=1 Tax=Campylobacter sp. RKI_CA19_01122 TaxID=2911627 RepID=UPI0039957C3D
MEKHIFNKNLEALSDKNLKDKLANFKQNNFDTKQGSDPLDVNFIHQKKDMCYITIHLMN